MKKDNKFKQYFVQYLVIYLIYSEITDYLLG